MTRFSMNFRSMMSHGASACQAEASSCMRTSRTNIAVILGAIIVASIIICALVSLLAVLGLLVSLLVLAVLLVTHSVPSPLTQRCA